jgi:hypothetical protein
VLALAEGVEATGPDGAPTTIAPLRTGPIDRLQTISGEGWSPILVDEHGRMVVAASEARAQTLCWPIRTC